MKQLWVRFDSGFQKLQSQTHCSDHLGHSDPLRIPYVENHLKTDTIATLKTSGSVDQRGRDRTERAEHSGYDLCGCKASASSPWAVNWEISRRCESPWDSSTGWMYILWVHQQLPTDNILCVLYCPSFNYRDVLSLQKAFQNVKPYAKGKSRVLLLKSQVFTVQKESLKT